MVVSSASLSNEQGKVMNSALIGSSSRSVEDILVAARSEIEDALAHTDERGGEQSGIDAVPMFSPEFRMTSRNGSCY